jgi:hypothetical protein
MRPNPEAGEAVSAIGMLLDEPNPPFVLRWLSCDREKTAEKTAAVI